VVVRKGRGCDRWSNHGGSGERVAGLREGRERETEKAEGVVGGRRERGLLIGREDEKKSGKNWKKGICKITKIPFRVGCVQE